MSRLFGIILCSLCFLMAANANEVPRSLLPLLSNRSVLADTFRAGAAACVSREDTSHILFRGCIDWHSSVHGNWALAAYANWTPEGKGALNGLSWFNSEQGLSAFKDEMEYLKANPLFERPYGRAWLLRLAIELNILDPENPAPGWTREVFEDLLEFSLSPERHALSGSYESLSWALINLYDYSDHFGLQEEKAMIIDAIRFFYLDVGNLTCDYDSERGSFMAICTNWAMAVSRVLERDEFDEWLEEFLLTNGLPDPIGSPRNAHEYGLNFSRAWGLWEMYDRAGLRRVDLVDAYSRHFSAGLEQYTDKSDDYRIAGHWVAQFGMFALQPLLGGR